MKTLALPDIATHGGYYPIVRKHLDMPVAELQSVYENDLQTKPVPKSILIFQNIGRCEYCHQQNALFYHVLTALGFSVDALAGRVVRMTPGRSTPNTHLLTLIRLAEGLYIAEVGFWGQAPPVPLRLQPGLEQMTTHGTYRLARDGRVYETQMRRGNRWEKLFRFTLDPQTDSEFEVADRFTPTYPRGRFTQTLVAARVTGEAGSSYSMQLPRSGLRIAILSSGR